MYTDFFTKLDIATNLNKCITEKSSEKDNVGDDQAEANEMMKLDLRILPI